MKSIFPVTDFFFKRLLNFFENSNEIAAIKMIHGKENNAWIPKVARAKKKEFENAHLKTVAIEKDRKKPLKNTVTGIAATPNAVNPNAKIKKGYFEKLKKDFPKV